MLIQTEMGISITAVGAKVQVHDRVDGLIGMVCLPARAAAVNFLHDSEY